MINLFTKFEVSKFTHYQDTKGNANTPPAFGAPIRILPRYSASENYSHWVIVRVTLFA